MRSGVGKIGYVFFLGHAGDHPRRARLIGVAPVRESLPVQQLGETRAVVAAQNMGTKIGAKKAHLAEPRNENVYAGGNCG